MPFADTLLPEFDQEMKTTRSLLERVPLEHAEWAPHTKSTKLGALANHLVNLAGFGTPIATQDGIDFAGRAAAPSATVPSRDALLASYDKNVAASRSAIQTIRDDAVGTPWTLRNGDHVVFTLPRAAVLRTLLMNHMVHHRGQLSVYLRLLNVPLPSIYGPTADT